MLLKQGLSFPTNNPTSTSTQATQQGNDFALTASLVALAIIISLIGFFAFSQYKKKTATSIN